MAKIFIFWLRHHKNFSTYCPICFKIFISSRQKSKNFISKEHFLPASCEIQKGQNLYYFWPFFIIYAAFL
ncbi:hypothetical protein AUJ40_01455 [Candidatus Berkelbacteria bacterium CG1_02_42_45]|uniref:Uncharacterized protein n=5 Tax=Candidatus Berkelbacteria TaxID=1618330 RepID=A0A2M7K147_9BACT|nr:MAG: hypothetical protein AUJ40_01455 [Candidatus Berkelbacteria bacterium CG1_02_42_45]PIP50873.1 MAG: hypothetical protein COX11_01780 [Candidatus Berkelbacteria bacterium CG23_combo_of_CG06-09_8_20_14_all_41_73]PIR27354.1 MAG: hypothetical protein COV40_01350 [Candidatus Berkelbacteria bacterium CG11_big_fil_rev_8_21_14_0_20_42_15]PIX29970.1 MAG: hypothetical protein COZ63_02245 [Candidatus Berkelbacteria bacterium CG_4_8_14_3_um_filter_42_13]PIZ27759.1 MAG: hypothetical protein COY45_007